MPNDKLQQFENIVKLLDTQNVSATDFIETLGIVLEQLKTIKDEANDNLTSTKEKLIKEVESNIAQINAKLANQDDKTSKGQKSLTEAITALKKDIKTSIKNVKDEIPELPDLTEIETKITEIQDRIAKPVVLDTGLQIKQKLLALSDKDKLALEDFMGFDNLIKKVESYNKRGLPIPQSGITTTFFSQDGTVIGRAKNINFSSTATQVTIFGDTATIPMGGSGSGATWTPEGVTNETVGGITSGTDLGTTPVTIESTLIEIFYPPSRPTVSLATSPSSGIKEAGDAITSVDLTPTTVAGSLPITTLDLTGTDGYSYSYPSPTPGGATEPTQTDSTGFVITTTYTATVGDGTFTGTSSRTFTYVFPYYKGVGVQNLTGIATDGGTLTKVVAGNPFTLALAFTTSNQVPYIVYPASYGKLRKVLDINGFDVSPDWGTQAGGPNTDITPWSTISVTNSFGATVSCYAYQFANLTSTTTTYTFSL